MTTKEIQIAVQRWLYGRSHIYQALNYGKSGYFEADILAMTASMRVTEVEVKISRSDFRADFKKKSKHELMKNIKIRPFHATPNRFYYACPSNLIRIDEIPAYVGLIYVCDDNVCMIVKDAPLLHKNKADDKLIIGMLTQLTEKSIYGGLCKMTFDNNQRKAEFEAYEAEKKHKTREFIDWANNKKLNKL